jgi:hypothetical protein
MTELIDGNIKFSDAYIGLLIGLLGMTMASIYREFPIIFLMVILREL